MKVSPHIDKNKQVKKNLKIEKKSKPIFLCAKVDKNVC